jgi:V8-like Glu-specific endopeptidase
MLGAIVARRAKIATSLRRLSCAILLAGLVIVPAEASNYKRIDLAVKELTQAQNSPDNRKQIRFVKSAIDHIRHSKPADEALKQQAVALVQASLNDLTTGDQTKFQTDVAQAITAAEAAAGSSGTATPEAVVTAPAAPASANRPVPTVKLTDAQAAAVVLIKGDNTEGTGFLVKMPEGPAVITNIHVISNNPHVTITTNSGAVIAPLSFEGATDRDMVMIQIKDDHYSYLDLATDIAGTVQPGDEIITPGNSEGGEVMLNTDGKVLGIGPQRIEFDNPVYHGNSGGPVFHVKSGKVIGVVTEAVKVDITDEVDKASFASRQSAIGNSMRYFGLRVDNVPKWEPYDWNRFLNETEFLDQFDNRNHALDTFLNAPDDNKPEDILWKSDEKIVAANNTFYEQAGGGDVSQRTDAYRQFLSDLNDVADTGVSSIQNAGNFYLFDQQRAKDEMAYRKALQVEMDSMGADLSRFGSLARKNN